MESLKVGQTIQIHSYKHDQSIHRIWQAVKILHVDDEKIIGCNHRTRVIESDGRTWVTKEPAVCYFYKNYWFNIIGMLKTDGLYFYCNLSSPCVYDGEALKYIDYDLDVKIFPDKKVVVLDRDEYKRHINRMDYPPKLRAVIESQLNQLLAWIEQGKEPFAKGFIDHWHHTFKTTK